MDLQVHYGSVFHLWDVLKATTTLGGGLGNR